jgi:HK97 family phage portal protein
MNNFFTKLFTPTEAKSIRVPAFFSNLVNQTRFKLNQKKTDDQLVAEYRNWVFACVNARAEEVASIEMYATRNGERVENSKTLKLLDDVNPFTTRYQLIFAMQAFKDLTGNAFWYLVRDKDGQGEVKEIYQLPSDKMNILISKDNPLTVLGYQYGQKGQEILFSPKEILHFRSFNPMGIYPSPHKGMGIVEASIWSIETDNEARNWNYSFFKNSAKPDGILTTETSLTDEAYDRLKQQWEQSYQGSSKNGKPAILENGLKWQDIAKTQKDMDFVAQRTFSRDEILAMFRVPRSVIGITDDVNRANAEASDYVFARRVIKPLMEDFITTLNEYLVKELEPDIVIEFKDPVPQDKIAQSNYYSLGINKWLTRNDIRRAEGLEPSDNGDVFYAPFSEAPQDNVQVEKRVKPSVISSKSSVDKTIDDFIAKLPTVKKEMRKTTASQKTVYKEIYLKRFDQNEKELIKDVKAYFTNQEAEVLKNLEDEFTGLKPKEYKLKGVEDVVFDKKKAIGTGISLITPHLRKFLAEGAELADNLTGGNYNANDPIALKFIQERAKFFAESITDTTATALLTSIKEGLDNGEGINDIADRVKAVYVDAETYRTERIARTEVSAGLNEGNIQAYKQAGVENVEWVAIADDRTAEECLANDGEVRKIGEAFSSGETQPPNHCNCRCSTNPVFND